MDLNERDMGCFGRWWRISRLSVRFLCGGQGSLGHVSFAGPEYLGFPMNIIRPLNAYCGGPKNPLCVHLNMAMPFSSSLDGATEQDPLRAGSLMLAGQADLYREVVERTAVAGGIYFKPLCKWTDDRLGRESCSWSDSSTSKCDIGSEPQTAGRRS
jgi:hypothetical protein